LEQCKEVNTKSLSSFYKVVLYTNCVEWANYLSPSCKFPIVYRSQNLQKLVGSRQSYRHNKRRTFFGPQHTLTGVITVTALNWQGKLYYYKKLSYC